MAARSPNPVARDEERKAKTWLPQRPGFDFRNSLLAIRHCWSIAPPATLLRSGRGYGPNGQPNPIHTPSKTDHPNNNVRLYGSIRAIRVPMPVSG